MRNMSVAHTIPQVKAGTKSETRRLGWANLKPGTVVMLVEKGQGIKKGGLKRIRPAVIKYNAPRRLDDISQEDVNLEGFPEMSPPEFVEFFCKAMKCKSNQDVNMIGWEYGVERTTGSPLSAEKIGFFRKCVNDGARKISVYPQRDRPLRLGAIYRLDEIVVVIVGRHKDYRRSSDMIDIEIFTADELPPIAASRIGGSPTKSVGAAFRTGCSTIFRHTSACRSASSRNCHP